MHMCEYVYVWTAVSLGERVNRLTPVHCNGIIFRIRIIIWSNYNNNNNVKNIQMMDTEVIGNTQH